MTGTHKIPLYGIKRQYSNLQKEILDVTDRVLQSGDLMDGECSKKFSVGMSLACERRYAIPVHSCTQALVFALRALKYRTTIDIPRVLIPTVSFIATVNAVYEAGCRPIFCDIDENGLMDLDKISNPKDIDIVMYVNLYGNVLDYNKLQLITKFFGRDIPIVEDAAQSFGAHYQYMPSGSLGTVSCLSFDPTKNFNNYGNGGMVLTDEHELGRDIESMRRHGIAGGHVESGTNSRMSEVDCAQMMLKLQHFPQWQQRRQNIANYYDSKLRDVVKVINYTADVIPSYSKYVIRTERRYELMTQLSSAGIGVKVTYEAPLPTYDLNIYITPTEYKMADQHCKTCLSLPIYPELTDAEVEFVAETVRKNL